MSKYLFTGGFGKLGSELSKLIPSDVPSHQELDILDVDKIDSILGKHNYEAIIHLAAITDRNYAASHKEESYLVNVVGTRNIAKLARKHKAKVFYLSTDYVFDCLSGNYTEDSEPNPHNWYGFTKLCGEFELRNNLDDYCIIRTSFRPDNWGFKSAYTNVYTIADYVDIIAKEIALAIRLDVCGLIHLGTNKKTLFELAKERNPNIKPEICLDENFPKNRDLNCNKWKEIKKQK